MSFSDSAKRWLDRQPEPNLRIAREILARREALAPRVLREGESVTGRAHETGVIGGMRLALSYLGDRPGDISQTGAEGYICDVESADSLAASDRPDPLDGFHGGKPVDPTGNVPKRGQS